MTDTLTLSIKVPAGLSKEQQDVAACAVERTGETLSGWLASVADGHTNTFELAWVTGQSLVDGRTDNQSACDKTAKTKAEHENDTFIRELVGEPISASEQVEMRLVLLQRSFAKRKELLEGSATASQVAQMLGISRQALHNKVKNNRTLFAAYDRSTLRLPLWQFDPQSETGILVGVSEVVTALTKAQIPCIAQISWMVRENPFLDNKTPLDYLQQGKSDRVVDAAQAVGLR